MSCNCGTVLFSGSLNATQSIGTGLPVGFSKNLAMGCSYTNTSVTIRQAGVYQVVVSASAATTQSSATNLTIELMNNGTQVSNVESTTTSTSTTDVQPMAFSALVKVDPTVCPLNDNSATLTVVNSGGDATYSNITITIIKVK